MTKKPLCPRCGHRLTSITRADGRVGDIVRVLHCEKCRKDYRRRPDDGR
jgi:transcription elongation factor Elf1